MCTLRILKKAILYLALGFIIRAREEYRFFLTRRRRVREMNRALESFRNLKCDPQGREMVCLNIVRESAKAMHLWLAENRDAIGSVRSGSEERVRGAKGELVKVGVPSSLAERLAKRNALPRLFKS